ncbi:MAG: hypothetical protein ACOYMA_20915 [Bacteroidia bacterium]
METTILVTCHSKSNFHQNRFLCLLILLLISGFCYSQRFDVWYGVELEKRLYPKIDTLKEKEVLLFIAKPSFVDPEYSIRIVDKANKPFLEVRLIEKNLRNELFRLKCLGIQVVSVKTDSFSIAISPSFRNRILSTFIRAIEINENRKKPSGPRFFDGICYEFRVNECGKSSSVEIYYELEKSYIENSIAMTNFQIVTDIRTNLFDELKYNIYK